jgi:hypothetical protein
MVHEYVGKLEVIQKYDKEGYYDIESVYNKVSEQKADCQSICGLTSIY